MIVSELVRFVVIGVVNTATYYGLYLVFRLDVPYLVAHALAFTLSMVGSFFLNTYWTYRTRPTWRKFLLFPLSNLANFAVTTLGIYLLVDVAGFDPRFAPLPAAATAVPFTFLLMRWILKGSAVPGHGRSGSPRSTSAERSAAAPVNTTASNPSRRAAST